MPLTIRPFTDADYDALVAVTNAVDPEHLSTADEARHHDAHRDPRCSYARWLAEEDAGVVAMAQYQHSEECFDPQHLWIEVQVPPAARRRGVGAAMYDHVIAAALELRPTRLFSVANERNAGASFLERRGFVENMREWESRLEPAAFNPTPYAELVASVEAAGIRLTALTELLGDADCYEQLHDLDQTLGKDVPSTVPPTRIPFETWKRNLVESPHLWAEGYWVALDGDRYVGVSNLWKSLADNILYTGLTGVRREHRRRGIATALKVQALTAGCASGVRHILTWNSTQNEGMLAINIALGFQRGPAWIHYEKQVAGL